jgi:hypothetical protein
VTNAAGINAHRIGVGRARPLGVTWLTRRA